MSKKQVTVVVSREELVSRTKRDGRNIYEPNAQRKLIEACLAPGVSVSGMALAHGLNTNVLRKWLIRERKRGASSESRRDERSTQSAPNLLLVTTLPEPAAEVVVPTTKTLPLPLPLPLPSASPEGNGAGRINIEMGGARIVVDGYVNATALSTVLDCLRGLRSR